MNFVEASHQPPTSKTQNHVRFNADLDKITMYSELIYKYKLYVARPRKKKIKFYLNYRSDTNFNYLKIHHTLKVTKST